ncbi:MAG TPA: glycosyl hydrolase [Lachnospiraceae bacterium]|nr:glycosyl hydrolase [Lachnospiraceae bacterium]
MLQQMTLEEKVLQLFVITPEALTGSDAVTAAGDTTKDSIRQYPVGGLVYFAGNLKSPEQVREMLTNTRSYYKEAGYPAPLLSLDEEGGKVARIGSQSAFGVEQFGDMAEVGRSGDTEEAERIGSVIGNYLADLGFNLDFAPDADVLTNPDNQVVKNRSFGSDPQLVADMVLAEVRGMEENGVYATLKHYPGHGATLGDTHAGYAYTDKTLEEMMEAELVPFTSGIQEGIHFIMVAHISAPAVTGDETPCSMSRYMITDVLRDRLGYDGIVITDAMNMGAISQQYTSADGAVGALKAGVDIVLMPSDFHSAYEGVLAAVQAGELTEERIEESVRRILRVKCGM